MNLFHHICSEEAMTNHLLLFLSLLLLTSLSNGQNPTNTTKAITMYPMQCSSPSPKPTCNSCLYVPSAGLPSSVVASLYSANATLIRTVFRQPMIQPDFLVQVPCGCEDTGTGTIAYFHNTKYRVQRGDTPTEITTEVFSGLAWNVTSRLQLEQVITINLLCGCNDGNDQAEVVSYTVQQGDTLSTIGGLLTADWGEIVRMNGEILKNPEFLIPGWVLFVPMGTAVAPPNPKGMDILVLFGTEFVPSP